MNIEGQTITSIHNMTKAEIEAEGWDDCGGITPSAVLVLSNGVKLYASTDYEGNGSGAIFGSEPNGKKFVVYVDK